VIAVAVGVRVVIVAGRGGLFFSHGLGLGHGFYLRVDLLFAHPSPAPHRMQRSMQHIGWASSDWKVKGEG